MCATKLSNIPSGDAAIFRWGQLFGDEWGMTCIRPSFWAYSMSVPIKKYRINWRRCSLSPWFVWTYYVVSTNSDIAGLMIFVKMSGPDNWNSKFFHKSLQVNWYYLTIPITSDSLFWNHSVIIPESVYFQSVTSFNIIVQDIIDGNYNRRIRIWSELLRWKKLTKVFRL